MARDGHASHGSGRGVGPPDSCSFQEASLGENAASQFQLAKAALLSASKELDRGRAQKTLAEGDFVNRGGTGTRGPGGPGESGRASACAFSGPLPLPASATGSLGRLPHRGGIQFHQAKAALLAPPVSASASVDSSAGRSSGAEDPRLSLSEAKPGSRQLRQDGAQEGEGGEEAEGEVAGQLSVPRPRQTPYEHAKAALLMKQFGSARGELGLLSVAGVEVGKLKSKLFNRSHIQEERRSGNNRAAASGAGAEQRIRRVSTATGYTGVWSGGTSAATVDASAASLETGRTGAGAGVWERFGKVPLSDRVSWDEDGSGAREVVRLQAVNERLAEEVDEFRREVERLRAEKKALEEDAREAEQEWEGRLEGVRQQLQHVTQERQGCVGTLEGTMHQLENMEEVKGELQSTKKQLDESRSAGEGLKLQVSSLEAELERWKRVCREVEEQMEEVQRALGKVKGVNEGVTAENKALAEENERLVAEKASLVRENEALKAQEKSLRDQIDGVMESVRRLVTQNQSIVPRTRK